jgi:hypothetical protein
MNIEHNILGILKGPTLTIVDWGARELLTKTATIMATILAGLPDGIFSYQKSQSRVYFGEPWNEKRAIWNISRPNGIFYSHLV